MFPVDPWHADTYDRLYQVFVTTVGDAGLMYRGKRVWMFPDMDDGKEVVFWHLTTREQKPRPVPRRMRHLQTPPSAAGPVERYPDLRRCERLPWVGPMVICPGDPSVLAWDHLEGDGATKTYVWLKGHDFVVIMKKMPDGSRRLITSFYVDREFKRQDFERKYAARVQ